MFGKASHIAGETMTPRPKVIDTGTDGQGCHESLEAREPPCSDNHENLQESVSPQEMLLVALVPTDAGDEARPLDETEASTFRFSVQETQPSTKHDDNDDGNAVDTVSLQVKTEQSEPRTEKTLAHDTEDEDSSSSEIHGNRETSLNRGINKEDTCISSQELKFKDENSSGEEAVNPSVDFEQNGLQKEARLVVAQKKEKISILDQQVGVVQEVDCESPTSYYTAHGTPASTKQDDDNGHAGGIITELPRSSGEKQSAHSENCTSESLVNGNEDDPFAEVYTKHDESCFSPSSNEEYTGISSKEIKFNNEMESSTCHKSPCCEETVGLSVDSGRQGLQKEPGSTISALQEQFSSSESPANVLHESDEIGCDATATEWVPSDHSGVGNMNGSDILSSVSAPQQEPSSQETFARREKRMSSNLVKDVDHSSVADGNFSATLALPSNTREEHATKVEEATKTQAQQIQSGAVDEEGGLQDVISLESIGNDQSRTWEKDQDIGGEDGAVDGKSSARIENAGKKETPQLPGAFRMGNEATNTEASSCLEGKRQLAFNPPSIESTHAPQNAATLVSSPSRSSPTRISHQWIPARDENPKTRWLVARNGRGYRRTSTRSSYTSNGRRCSAEGGCDSVTRSCLSAANDAEDPSEIDPAPAGSDNILSESDPRSESTMRYNKNVSPTPRPLEIEVPTIQAKLVEVSEEAPIHATIVDDDQSKRRRCYVVAFVVLVSALATTLTFVIKKSAKERSNSKTYVCETPGLAEMMPGKYEGVSVNYLSFATNISSPSFPVRANEFEACTGGKIIFSEAANVWEDPIADLGSKASRGAEIFDGYLMSNSHFPEASHLGLLEHLNDRIRNSNEQIQWQDLLPKVQSMSKFRKDGTSFVDFLMFDGDFFVPIVRLDLLEEHRIPLPNTWDELVEVASYFNGTDLNEDGVPDYGFCHFPRHGAGYWDWWFAEFVYGTWASVEQTEGTQQGFLFDERTFEPRVGAGFRFAAGIWKELWRNGANCENTNFVEGRCAIGLGPPGCWKQVFQKGVKRVDDEGSLLWQPTMASGEYAEPYRFKTFGSTLVVDRATGEMVPCTRKLCPKAEAIPKRGHHGDEDRAKVLPVSPLEGQLINRVPYYWSGGLGTAIRKSSDPIKKDLIWDFFTYTNSPETSVQDLVDYPSWLDAWRYSQLSPGDNFLAANWSETAFREHFEIMHWALSKESNGAYNLRLPGAAEYTRDVVGEAMLSYIEDHIENEDELVAEVITGWNKITRNRGKQDQLQIYRASLDLEQLPPQ